MKSPQYFLGPALDAIMVRQTRMAAKADFHISRQSSCVALNINKQYS